MATYPASLIWRPERFSLSSGAPSGEPVTVAAMKSHGWITDSADDTLVSGFAIAARKHVEDITNRALVTQTRTLKLDRFPVYADQLIELPGGNIQSVTSVQYVDGDGDTQVWGASNYETDFGTDGGTGRLGLAYDKSWPTIRAHGLPVTITYVAGWTDDGASPPDYGANVPQPLKTAIGMMTAGLYDLRHATLPQEQYANPFLDALIAPYRIRRIW